MVFLAIMVAAGSGGAFLITTQVTRDGLTDLFGHRLGDVELVFEQYARGNHLVRVQEIETLLSSPRFLAALETGDSQTVAGEIPTHGVLEDAAFVCVTAPDGGTLFRSSGPAEDLCRRHGFPLEVANGTECVTVRADGELYEVVTAPVVANNGSVVGTLAIGRALPDLYVEDLHRLTGFEVVLSLDGHEVARSRSVPGPAPATPEAESPFATIDPGHVTPVRAGDEEVLAYRLDDPTSGLSVTFVGSAERAIAPIMADVRRLLLALAVGGFVLAMATVWIFGTRRVGGPVQRLARHADRIATGDLDFVIEEPGAPDELGKLAATLERMRSDLARSRREVEEAHRAQLGADRMAAIGQMATGIIHDFKNPMAVVRGTADLIHGRDPENEKLAKQCTVIHRQIDRMVALTRDLLEYAKGRTDLQVETVELADWVGEIEAAHAEACRRAGVRLHCRGPRGLRVLLDPDRMRRVLDNLLTNARDVSGPGDTVSVVWSRGDGSEVVLEVADEGPGVPADLISRIFDPFVTAGKEHGSGLGLAIAKKIVEDHGARLEVASEVGGGARFLIRFPAKLHVADGLTTREGISS